MTLGLITFALQYLKYESNLFGEYMYPISLSDLI
jgi:hypothetical protein